jgi:hypothetical protein
VAPIAVGALWNKKLEMRWLVTDELIEFEKLEFFLVCVCIYIYI